MTQMRLAMTHPGAAPGLKPAALMLSHCPPEAGGSDERARAWQLLRLASRSHRVFLACLADGPLRLSAWRDMRSLAERVVLGAPARTCPGVLRWLGLAARGRATAGRALVPAAAEWCHETRFDALLCTHARLWGAAAALPADRHACDLGVPGSVLNHRLASMASSSGRTGHSRLAREHAALEARIAAEADLVLVATAWLRDVPSLRGGAVASLPEDADTDHPDSLAALLLAAGAGRRPSTATLAA